MSFDSLTMEVQSLPADARRKLMAFPQHEAIIGFTHASKAGATAGPTRTFKTEEDAISAWRRGEAGIHDNINIEAGGSVKKVAWVTGPGEEPDLLATALCWLGSDDA